MLFLKQSPSILLTVRVKLWICYCNIIELTAVGVAAGCFTFFR